MRRRRGFIILFGTRGIVASDNLPSIVTRCPQCGEEAEIQGKIFRQWFTLFLIPVFPVGRVRQFSQCTRCGAQFPVSTRDISKRLAESDQEQSQHAITLYNSLRASPANSITLNDLMQLYASLKEPDQAISAAAAFPDALNASEQCMTTLGRIYLGKEEHGKAIQWFNAAIARNESLGEAHYFRAIAHATTPTSPDYSQAVASARAARNARFPHADELLRDLEAKSRETIA